MTDFAVFFLGMISQLRPSFVLPSPPHLCPGKDPGPLHMSTRTSVLVILKYCLPCCFKLNIRHRLLCVPSVPSSALMNIRVKMSICSSTFKLHRWFCVHRENVRAKITLKHCQSCPISPLIHLKNEQKDWISTNDMVNPGGHSDPVHVLTLCWLFKRNLHVEASLWNRPYYYLWSGERPCELF